MKLTYSIMLISAGALLAACGGGGGGSTTEPDYNGLKSLVSVDNGNYVPIIDSFMDESGSPSVIQAGNASAVTAPVRRMVAGFTRNALKKGPAESPLPSQPCAISGEKTMSFASDAQGVGNYSIVFSHCAEDDTLMHGKISGRVNAVNSEYLVPTSFSVRYTGLSVVELGEGSGHMNLDGLETTRLTLATHTEVVKSTVLTVNVDEGTSTYRRNQVVTTVYDNLLQPTSGQSTITGEFYVGTLGRVNVSTPVPLALVLDREGDPHFISGAVAFKGAAGSTVRLDLRDGAEVDAPLSTSVALDATGDQIYEWVGYRAGTSSGTTPLAVIAAPSLASVGQHITLFAEDSLAPQRRALTFNWTLQSRPAGSVATLLGSQTLTSSLFPDVAGAYTVMLQVSDGIHSHETTQQITVSAAVAPGQTALGFNAQQALYSSAANSVVILSSTPQPAVHVIRSADALVSSFSLDAEASLLAVSPNGRWAAVVVGNELHEYDLLAGMARDTVMLLRVPQKLQIDDFHSVYLQYAELESGFLELQTLHLPSGRQVTRAIGSTARYALSEDGKHRLFMMNDLSPTTFSSIPVSGGLSFGPGAVDVGFLEARDYRTIWTTTLENMVILGSGHVLNVPTSSDHYGGENHVRSFAGILLAADYNEGGAWIAALEENNAQTVKLFSVPQVSTDAVQYLSSIELGKTAEDEILSGTHLFFSNVGTQLFIVATTADGDTVLIRHSMI